MAKKAQARGKRNPRAPHQQVGHQKGRGSTETVVPPTTMAGHRWPNLQFDRGLAGVVGVILVVLVVWAMCTMLALPFQQPVTGLIVLSVVLAGWALYMTLAMPTTNQCMAGGVIAHAFAPHSPPDEYRPEFVPFDVDKIQRHLRSRLQSGLVLLVGSKGSGKTMLLCDLLQNATCPFHIELKDIANVDLYAQIHDQLSSQCCSMPGYSKVVSRKPPAVVVKEVFTMAHHRTQQNVLLGIDLTATNVSSSDAQKLVQELQHFAAHVEAVSVVLTCSEGPDLFWPLEELKLVSDEMTLTRAQEYLRHVGCLDVRKEMLRDIPRTLAHLQQLAAARDKVKFCSRVQGGLANVIQRACQELSEDAEDLNLTLELLSTAAERPVEYQDLRKAGVDEESFTRLLVKTSIFKPPLHGSYEFQSEAARKAALFLMLVEEEEEM